jgi:hypothetical protein
MFIAVHCPRPGCSNHHHPKSADWYRFFGIYRTKTFGSIPRFRCRSCRITFFSQTFSINYYAEKALKMRDLYARVNRLRHVEVAGADRGELEMMLVGFFIDRYFSADKISSEGSGKKSQERRWETPLRKNSKTVRKHLAV